MELLVAAVIAGVAVAVGLMTVWKVVSRAVDNGLDWLILNFGNEQAAKRVEEKLRARE